MLNPTDERGEISSQSRHGDAFMDGTVEEAGDLADVDKIHHTVTANWELIATPSNELDTILENCFIGVFTKIHFLYLHV